jgi:glucose-6-phosphate 1-dehydrogenase
MTRLEPHLFVVFGGTGDLAQRKLIPSLYRLLAEEGGRALCTLLGVARKDLGDDGYREWVAAGLTAAGLPGQEVASWCAENVYFQTVTEDAAGFAALRARVEAIETEHHLVGNRVFYLAIPPGAFTPTIVGLGDSGLSHSDGWVRIVVEKPFGTDLTTAKELNALLLSHFDESQVYRIDHYLGKATVQNLLTFRFSNPMFEWLWNRDRVLRVEITVAEELGIEGRAGFYEHAGVVRDVVQNHLTQLLALIAMEPPNLFEADQIRDEKVRVLDAVSSIEPDDVVFGQYVEGVVDGANVPGYRQEQGVPPDSRTPTFAGIRLYVDTWRWEGIPFLLRTGKRLPHRTTQIAVTFREPPLCLFHGTRDECLPDHDVLLMILEPDEGFTLRFNVKAPDSESAIDAQSLHFRYADVYSRLLDAYQTLILDILEGDQTLFVRADEVEASWRIYGPVLASGKDPIPYAAGTWGPDEMAQGVPLGGEAWMERTAARA